MISKIKKIRTKINEGVLQEMWREAVWIYLYASKYWKAIIYYILIGILGTGMGLAGSVASKYLIDAVTGYDKSNIAIVVSIIIGMALGNLATGAITSRISTKISLKVNNEIQADIYYKIMNTDWESISTFHSGDILNRFNGDVNTVASSVLGWLPSLITRLLQFLGTLAIILYYDPTMAVIALLSAPVTLLLSRMLVTRMRQYNKKMKQISSEVMAFNEESFQKLKIIKCFDLNDYFLSKLRKVQKSYTDYAMDYNRFSIYTSTFMSLVGMVVSYATFGWGVYRLWSGAITYGTMTLFLQLSGNLSSGFSSLVSMVPSAIGATTSAGRLMAIINLPREEEKYSHIVNKIDNSTKNEGLTIELSHINFHYQGRDKVLQDVSMCARPNEIVAIVGPSGEGKTTLINIMLGLLNPFNGEARIIDSHGQVAPVSKATRKFFSYVPQGNQIFSGTIAENLRLIKPDATDEELVKALEAACAYDFIKNLPEGIYTEIGENGCGFSEGQSQRISIARALLRDAPVMLLDEATSALDPTTEKNVLKGIMEFRKNHTCILTTHRKSVLAMCDKVYKINETKITEFLSEQFLEKAVDF